MTSSWNQTLPDAVFVLLFCCFSHVKSFVKMWKLSTSSMVYQFKVMVTRYLQRLLVIMRKNIMVAYPKSKQSGSIESIWDMSWPKISSSSEPKFGENKGEVPRLLKLFLFKKIRRIKNFLLPIKDIHTTQNTHLHKGNNNVSPRFLSLFSRIIFKYKNKIYW